MKKTIAWIGRVNQQEDILEKLAERYRVLWVRRGEGSTIPKFHQHPESKVETIDCVKDGCWEADIIVLTEQEIQKDLLERIRDVATQKTVLVVTSSGSNADEEERLSRIQETLPFSKIVELALPFETEDTAIEIVRLLGSEAKT